jgi:preprotein translocase subunit Sec61beta
VWAAIIVLPLVLIFLYDSLGGGLLNGFYGSDRTPVLDPDLILILGTAVGLVLGVIFLNMFLQYQEELRAMNKSAIPGGILLFFYGVEVLIIMSWKLMMG